MVATVRPRPLRYASAAAPSGRQSRSEASTTSRSASWRSMPVGPSGGLSVAFPEGAAASIGGGAGPHRDRRAGFLDSATMPASSATIRTASGNPTPCNLITSPGASPPRLQGQHFHRRSVGSTWSDGA
jgi:hypothetical protein